MIAGFFILASFAAFSQDDETEEELPIEEPSVMEIGADGYFGASNLGGSAGIGLKFGYKLNENVIVGPSFRFQRTWSSYYAQTVGYTVYGGGAWIHGRFANTVFVGAEFEYLRTPVDIVLVGGQRTWVPTLFLGGGFSREFNKRVRLNAGIFYDVIDNPRSPFRPGYFMKKTNSNGMVVALIPVIYRIGFFFPL